MSQITRLKNNASRSIIIVAIVNILNYLGKYTKLFWLLCENNKIITLSQSLTIQTIVNCSIISRKKKGKNCVHEQL